MTQRELAEAVDITPVWLSYIKSGKATPSGDVADRLAKILGVSAAVLFGPVDGRKLAIDKYIKASKATK